MRLSESELKKALPDGCDLITRGVLRSLWTSAYIDDLPWGDMVSISKR